MCPTIRGDENVTHVEVVASWKTKAEEKWTHESSSHHRHPSWLLTYNTDGLWGCLQFPVSSCASWQTRPLPFWSDLISTQSRGHDWNFGWTALPTASHLKIHGSSITYCLLRIDPLNESRLFPAFQSVDEALLCYCEYHFVNTILYISLNTDQSWNSFLASLTLSDWCLWNV